MLLHGVRPMDGTGRSVFIRAWKSGEVPRLQKKGDLLRSMARARELYQKLLFRILEEKRAGRENNLPNWRHLRTRLQREGRRGTAIHTVRSDDVQRKTRPIKISRSIRLANAECLRIENEPRICDADHNGVWILLPAENAALRKRRVLSKSCKRHATGTLRDAEKHL